ncbi:MAG TPA: rhomboid family intramembrane serine protease [Myxococcales bacterium]
MLLRLSSDFRRAMDLSLVLDQEGIAHDLRSVGEEQWALLVDDVDGERAAVALAAFELENAPRPPVPEPVPVSDGVVAAALFALPIVVFHLWTGPESANTWFTGGDADAAAIVHGEWFRALTALTLHADAGHAAGNAVLGAIFVGLLARRLGTGIALLLTVCAGAFGTLATAFLVQRDFASVGASTAVFAALGALAVLPERRGRKLAAAVALLGFLGTGKRADLCGHLCGFLFGLVLGWLAGAAADWISADAKGAVRRAALQAACCMAALALPVLAWVRALR